MNAANSVLKLQWQTDANWAAGIIIIFFLQLNAALLIAA